MDASCDDLIRNTLETIKITKTPLAFIVLERGSGAIYRLEVFERFEWPYLQRFVDAFLAEGITPWFHLDTDWSLNLPYFKTLPRGKCVADLDGTTNIFNIIERDVLYTQAGFLVWRLDNRGSFGRGHGFEAPIFGELGKAALEDQLAGIEYLQTLPYVDATRIGTDGKSFGGYMTLYALRHAPDVLRCGVAGAAPTDWSYYDTIYTERYMDLPQSNPDGYRQSSPVHFAGDYGHLRYRVFQSGIMHVPRGVPVEIEAADTAASA